MEPLVLLENIWLTISIWSVLFFGQVLLTRVLEQRYRAHLLRFIVYEDMVQNATESKSSVNQWKRWILRWSFAALCFYVIWWLSEVVVQNQGLFSFMVGALMLQVGTNYLRNVRSWAMIRYAQLGGIEGNIRYSRWFLLKVLAMEFVGFGVLFFALGWLFSSWFFYGGAYSQWLMALWYWRLSRIASA